MVKIIDVRISTPPHLGEFIMMYGPTFRSLVAMFAFTTGWLHAEICAQPVPAGDLRVVRCDSEEVEAEKAPGTNAVDGNPASCWITRWKSAQPGFPHELVIALATPRTLAGVELRPRPGGANAPDEFEVNVSNDGQAWTPAFSGRYPAGKASERFLFKAPAPAGWLRLVVRSAKDRKPYLALAEVTPLTADAIPCRLDLAQGEHRQPEAWLKAGGKSPDGTEIGVNSLFWTKNGQPWTPVMGEFHFYRYPAALWEQELRKMKAGGLSIVSTYVFWEAAEEPKGTWNWTGDNDLRRFVQAAQRAGLYVWLRPGPYVNGEIRHRGIPDWAWKLQARTDNPAYLAAVKVYFEQVAAQAKGLWFRDGGPIIGCQLENEYAHGSKDHLASLKKIAEEAGFAPAFYSATCNSEYRYERGDVLPLQGAYPYRYWCAPGPTSDFLYATDEWGAMENLGRLYYDFEKFPRGMCELGGGCLNGYTWRFVVPAYDMEGSLQNVLGRGINLPGYYMYHGGTHKPGMKDPNGIPQNFDYQAPLGEFGQRRASYRSLKLLHHFLNDYGSLLADMQPVRPAGMVRDPKEVSRLRYVGRFQGDRGFLFMTTCQPYVEHGGIPGAQVELKLSQETMKVPARPIDLPADISPVFPVNLDLNGTTLRYATAQPLCKLMDGPVPCFVFFAYEGIAPEFQLAADARIETRVPMAKEGTVVNVHPSTSRQVAFSVTAPDGRQAKILLLSRQDAERSWRLDFLGAPRLLLSSADLNPAAGGGLELVEPETTMDLSVFPPVSATVLGVVPRADGIFSAYTFTTPRAEIGLAGTPLPAKSWTMSVPKALPENVRELLVQARYVGSTAELRADKQLHTDHRHIGLPFEFGVRRFIDNGTKELTMIAQPWDKNVRGLPAEVAPQTPEEEKGMIRSVTAVPEYVIRVR